MPVFFIDEYRQLRHRDQKVHGFYFTLANLPEELYLSPSYRFLLSLVTSDMDVLNAVEQVIVRRCRQLENGIYLDVDGEDTPVCGSVFAVHGDHPGKYLFGSVQWC